MVNMKVSRIFREIADYMELAGENMYKIRAYRKAAHELENLKESLDDIRKKGNLESIPGVGKAIAEKIEEILDTGKCLLQEDLKSNIPSGTIEIMKLPGVGAKMAKLLFQELHITSIEDLYKAAKERKIRSLAGMGPKKEQNILRSIKMMQSLSGLIPIGLALKIGIEIVGFLEKLPYVQEVSLGGSLRRWKELVGDIDIVASSKEPDKVIAAFVHHPQIKEILAQGDTKVSIINWLGVQLDLRVVQPEEFVSTLHHFTGSKEHNVRLREIAKKMGLKINEYGITELDNNNNFVPKNEKEIYNKLNLPFIPVELREDRGEIEAALEKRLPELVELKDIQGDLHIHSNWSDGVNSIEEIISASKERGYKYAAITDHSRSLGIAKGLSEERLINQRETIRKLNQKEKDFTILSGIEMDIKTDGTLDYYDDILKEMDWVIASIHSGFKQDKEKITNRIINAVKNPHVNVIAHPTGRLLGRRDPYGVDVEAVIEAAAKYNTALEINSSPDRLDLNDHYVRMAMEMGVKIVINTDAHEISAMDDMIYGIEVARRGWLKKEDILNTYNIIELQKYLKECSEK